MNRHQPHSSDYHHPYPSTSRGLGSRPYHDFCTTDPKDHPEGIIYCDLNRPVLPPPPPMPMHYFPTPPPPYHQPFPQVAHHHHNPHPHSFHNNMPAHTQPHILHALLTAPPPPPAFILPSPPVSYSDPFPLPTPPPYYSTSHPNVSPHSSISSGPNYSPLSSANLSSSDNENEEYHHYSHPPPEKRPRLATDLEVGIYNSGDTPTQSRSLASTPELYIDESVHPEDGKEEPCGYGPHPSCQGMQGFQDSSPPEPASPPPPMVVASHKKFHYKTWASANGSNTPRPQYIRCNGGGGSSESASCSYDSCEPISYGMQKLKQSPLYNPEEHLQDHQYCASGQRSDEEDEGGMNMNMNSAFSALGMGMTGEIHHSEQHSGGMATPVTSRNDNNNNDPSPPIPNEAHDKEEEKAEGNNNGEEKAEKDDNNGAKPDDEAAQEDSGSDEGCDLYKELEEYLETRERLMAQDNNNNDDILSDVDEFGGHVSEDLICEMMDVVVGELEELASAAARENE